jgi:hypothetical protein
MKNALFLLLFAICSLVGCDDQDLCVILPEACENPDLPKQGESCIENDVCVDGLKCVHYYGIGGASGPEFASCEIPCIDDTICPANQICGTIADGPGDVCRPKTNNVGDYCDPSAYKSCGDELVCVGWRFNQPGECMVFDHGQTVGLGYACGGSIGVDCVEVLGCIGMPPEGVDGGTGTCEYLPD